MRFKRRIWGLTGAAVTLLMLAPETAQTASGDEMNCTAIWEAEHKGHRFVAFELPYTGWASSHRFQLEAWSGKELQWTLEGVYHCSVGVSTCTITIETHDGEGKTAVVERIDSTGDGKADYLVFAGLGQMLHYGGGPKVTWFSADTPIEAREVPLIPNVYKSKKCS